MSKRDKTEVSLRDKKAKRQKEIKVPAVSSKVIVPVSIDCFKLEEKEANDETFHLFIETCDSLHDVIEGIFTMKRNSTATEDIMYPLKLNFSMNAIRLKKINRLDKQLLQKSRLAVNERKQSSDAENLQFQNLLYELTHLQGEETKCLEFRSLDEDIRLVSIEEFYRDAPVEISKPHQTKKNSHEQQLARLSWEIEQRKKVSETLAMKEILSKEMREEIKQIEEKLANIEPAVDAVIRALEPFENKMGFPLLAQKAKHKKAKNLPNPLYVLYVQAVAFSEHFGTKKMEIRIEGNTEDLKALQMKEIELSDESGDSDQEENTETERRKRRTKNDEPKRDILLCHPMSVFITLHKESKLELQFRYLVHMKIVTASVKSIAPEPMSTELIGDVLMFDKFLDHLFLEDVGRETPNLASIYALKGEFNFQSPTFTNDTTGYPYIWAQKISGLHFVNPSPPRVLHQEIPSSIEDTVQAICQRLKSRTQLFQQIQCIDQKINVPEAFIALYPKNISSHIKKWSTISYEDVKNDPRIEDMIELDLVHQDCFFYKAEIQRASATLVALVIVAPNYPAKTPVCLLDLIWGDCNLPAKSYALKELEEEVNVSFFVKLSPVFKDKLLLCQIYHLCVCFDVYIETDGYTEPVDGPLEFLKEKICLHNAWGPARSRPYQCLTPQGIFTFRP